MGLHKNLKSIKGDASFRKFFRKKDSDRSSVIVYAKKEKLKNLIIYDSINKILIKNKILAPTLYNENYNQHYIEIQDFGDETILKILRKKNNNLFDYFKKAIRLLNRIQQIKDIKVETFKNKIYKIPKYDDRILIKEANLFCDWYAKKNLSKIKRNKFSKEFKKIIKTLISNLKLRNNIFVHRDFHVSNLMYFKNKICIIDSQDALIGNKAYDLASLIDDVRFRTSNKFKEKVYNYYIKTNKKINLDKFNRDFLILSVLRNFKIIGIFMRLAKRDNKKKYLKLIPYAWELIDYRMSQNKIFDNLFLLIRNNFPKF